MLHILKRFAGWAGLAARRCDACSVLTNRESGSLCLDCAEALFPRIGGYCPECGEMFEDDSAPPTVCGECRQNPQPWDRLYFHSIYAGRVRDLILSYKFSNGFGRSRLLSDMAHRTFKVQSTRLPDMIIPVPLHTRRLLWRGFNQSSELCRTVSKKIGKPVIKDGLTRIRHTQPQTRLGRKERQENIKDAFVAKGDVISGHTVLLVDDVYTTGATLRECTKTLRQACAAGVDVLVLARAQS